MLWMMCYSQATSIFVRFFSDLVIILVLVLVRLPFRTYALLYQLLMFWYSCCSEYDVQLAQQLAKSQYDSKVAPATLLPKKVGNMYCASLYAGLVSLLHNKSDSLVRCTSLAFFKFCRYFRLGGNLCTYRL
jgi:3-hydroxy-3-methylglutaryl CoA synthase